MSVDLVEIFKWLAVGSMCATAARIALSRLREPLAIWKPVTDGSRFWAFYNKVEATTAWLAGALEKYGKKKDGGTNGSTLNSVRDRGKNPADSI